MGAYDYLNCRPDRSGGYESSGDDYTLFYLRHPSEGWGPVIVPSVCAEDYVLIAIRPCIFLSVISEIPNPQFSLFLRNRLRLCQGVLWQPRNFHAHPGWREFSTRSLEVGSPQDAYRKGRNGKIRFGGLSQRFFQPVQALVNLFYTNHALGCGRRHLRHSPDSTAIKSSDNPQQPAESWNMLGHRWVFHT